MLSSEKAFPMDVTDPSGHWKFRPDCFLVVILDGPDEAQGAEAALAEAGFPLRDVRGSTGKQTLENHAVNMGRRALTRKLAGRPQMISKVEISISGMHGRMEAPCGFGCPTQMTSQRGCEFSPTTTIHLHAHTHSMTKQTFDSPEQEVRKRRPPEAARQEAIQPSDNTTLGGCP